MAKLGKFSTGFGTKQPKSAPFKNSNGGYNNRLKLDLNDDEDISMEGRGTTGRKLPIKSKDHGAKRTF